MREIQDVIEARAQRLSAGDAKGMVEYYAPGVVQFSLAPPLGATIDGNDPGPTEQWLAGFAAPPRREVTQLQVTADGDVAFATSIDSMTATPQGATEPFTLWYRVTVGLRRIDGRWLITHEHASVPFYMDGSFKAAVDLKP